MNPVCGEGLSKDSAHRSHAMSGLVLVNAFEQYLRQLGFEVAFDKTGGSWSMGRAFDSSSSLATSIGLAGALAQAGEVLRLTSRDGLGPFEPDGSFLKANPASRDGGAWPVRNTSRRVPA